MPLIGTNSAGATDNVIPVVGSFLLNAIDCTSTSFCLAVGGFNGTSFVTQFVDGVDGGVTTLPGQLSLDALACPTASTCYAVGNTQATNPPDNNFGVIVPITFGIVGTPVEVPGTENLSSIACTTGTTTCVAVGLDTTDSSSPPYTVGTVVALSNGSPSSAVQEPAGFLSLSSVACPSGGSCLAVGTQDGATASTGGLIPITNGVAGTAQTDSNLYLLSALACSTTTQCYAAGDGPSGQQVVSIDSGVAVSSSAVEGLSDFTGATCPTSTQCYFTGEDSTDDGYVLPVTSGVAGTLQTDITGGQIYGLDCLSASQCVAVGGEDNPIVGVIITSAVQTAPATISSVVFGGKGYSQTVTVKGTNFGAWKPVPSPVFPVHCVTGSPSYDYPQGTLSFSDNTGAWSAGAPGNCIGLVVKSWTNTQVVLAFGTAYVWPLLTAGDSFQVTVQGATYSGTSPIGKVAPPTVKSVKISGLGTSTSPTVTVSGSNFGSRIPVPDPLTPPSCASGDTSLDYTPDQLYFDDQTQGWTAGEPGDCIGLVVSKWTPTAIVYSFGASYPGDISPGDNIQVGVLSSIFDFAVPPG